MNTQKMVLVYLYDSSPKPMKEFRLYLKLGA